MSYQEVLPFNEEYPWLNLIKHLRKLSQSEKISFYGIRGRKITLRCIKKGTFLITSYSINALKYNIEQEGNLKFIEVQFMSTMAIDKHLCIYEKSNSKAATWDMQIYICRDPHCNSFKKAELIVGKSVRCFKCKGITTVGKIQFWKRNKHIVCVGCSKSPKAAGIKAAKEVMGDILDEIKKELEDDPILKELENESKS